MHPLFLHSGSTGDINVFSSFIFVSLFIPDPKCFTVYCYYLYPYSKGITHNHNKTRFPIHNNNSHHSKWLSSPSKAILLRHLSKVILLEKGKCTVLLFDIVIVLYILMNIIILCRLLSH